MSRDACRIDTDFAAIVVVAAELVLDIKSAIAYIILLIKHFQFIVLCLIVYGTHTHTFQIFVETRDMSFNVALYVVDPLLNLYVYMMRLAKPLETHKIKVTLPY